MADTHALYNAAEKLFDEGKLEEAADRFKEVLALDESNVLAHLALARVSTKLGRHDEAIAHSRRACELEPTDAFNYTALSVTYQRAWAGTGDHRYIQLAEEAKDAAHRM